MNRRVSAALLGFFIVGAIIILMVGITQFGREALLGRGENYVLYFSGSMKGLQVGSPVTYRGLKVGEVTSVRLQYDPATRLIEVPVYIQFVQSSRRSDEDVSIVQQLISDGLRAQLQLQNLLTGELGVEVNFHPDTPIELRGLDLEYIEIPTIPAAPGAQEMLQETLENANITLERIRDFVTSPDLTEALQTLKQSLISFDLALNEARGLIINIDDQVEPFAIYIQDAADSFMQAADSFRVLSEYLARHPEAIIVGKT